MFYILDRHPKDVTSYKEAVLLIKDHWDDWFTFETQFYSLYVDSNKQLHEIGSVKIGQMGMKKGQRSPDIPSEFPMLPEDCFSLGQSDLYYENIKNLGDFTREKILSEIRDIAYSSNLYVNVRNQEVTKISLMRDISHFMVTNQYRRIAHGNARLTNYEIEYTYPNVDEMDEVKMNFNVIPDSNPPTNIHVVIGRNNVGKTYLIKNIICSLYNIDDGVDHGVLRATNDSTGRLVRSKRQAFANVLCVSFSPFDSYSDILAHVNGKKAMPFTYIGINQTLSENNNSSDHNNSKGDSIMGTASLADTLRSDFYKSLKNCLHSKRKMDMLSMVIGILESDPIFERSDLRQLIVEGHDLSEDELLVRASGVFRRLSSGHQVIMLTLTQLIAYLTERTFVILDEPENHLHPPLLAAFVRALSELLIRYNGVALVATHSPVILQEVPRRCVWRINRNGNEVTTSRLDIETFGATIGSLTREVFGLEVRKSGFHKLLSDEVQKGKDYSQIKELFNEELGDEALALLRTLIILRDKDEI